MSVTYGFYDSLSGDRKYTAAQMSRIFEGIIVDGVFASVGSGLVVSAQGGGSMNVIVGTGRAWFNFTWTLNDAPLYLTVSDAPVALNRIDTVVLEVNTDSSVRANTIKIIAGTPASSPVPPTLANTSTLKQYGLANISVGSGVTSISNANITNLIGTTQTPWVSGPLTTIDASTLYAQFEAEFNAWFTDLQNELDTNQAANLQAQINDLETGWVEAGETWTYAASDAPSFTFTVPGDKTGKYFPRVRIKLTQTSTKYFIVTKATYSAPNTTVTLYGGTDYTLANATITDPYYSLAETPFGFPAEADKWTVVVADTSLRTQNTPTQYMWYNLNSTAIVVPIGAWRLSYEVEVGVTLNATSSDGGMASTLSTTNNTPDSLFTEVWLFPNLSGTFTYRKRFGREALVTLTNKSTRYLNVTCNWSGATSLDEYGNSIVTKIIAESLYI